MNKYKKELVSLMVIFILSLTACSGNQQSQQSSMDYNTEQTIETVTVERGTITPTISAQTVIVQASPFILSSPVNGTFETQRKVGDKLTAGDVVGKISGSKLKMPVNGTILSLVSSGENIPKNYPVAVVRYTGFSLNVEAENYLKTLPEDTMFYAKFQVSDGIGPTDAIAVVNPAMENSESMAYKNFIPQSNILQCLISREVYVKSGQNATVVISAETRKDVLILPLSAVAGRMDKGLVTVIKNGKSVQTEVTLGVSDGAYIEILSGVKEGEKVSAISPNLDPRRNS